MNNCLLHAVSKLTGLGYEECQKQIGHDGSERIGRYKRGYHFQEIIWKILVPGGYALTPFEPMPVSEWPDGNERVIVDEGALRVGTREALISIVKRTSEFFDTFTGLVEGVNANGKGHAYAVCNGMLYDQRGQHTLKEVADEGFCTKCLWKLDKVK